MGSTESRVEKPQGSTEGTDDFQVTVSDGVQANLLGGAVPGADEQQQQQRVGSPSAVLASEPAEIR